MARTSVAIVFAGSGGAGAMTAGTVLLRAAAHAGYYGLMTQLFGPQVRGGEAAALVQIATEPIEAQPNRFDLFVALDWERIDQYSAEIPLDSASAILADPAAGAVRASVAKSKARVVALAMNDPHASRLERGLSGRRTNMFAAGVVTALIGIEQRHLQAAIDAVLADKGEETIAANRAGAASGIEAAAGLALNLRLDPPRPAARWLISGNQALALGALRGGVRFVGCYPITPATDLVEWLAPEIRKLGGRLVQAEDELAAINMTLGASYGGTPAMAVTSGPGMSLMGETLGLAVAAEVPAVIVDVMRAGPSTGIASKTEQSDVNIAIYGGHGDAPRVVLAPTSITDCLNTAEYAVYVAESLQTPVVVLSDQALGQAYAVIDPSGNRPKPLKRRTNGAPPGTPLFKRYAVDGDPLTAMPLPGTPGYQWVAEGLTHNEIGLPASGAGMHAAQLNKRARKLQRFDPGELWGETWGEGDTVLLAFGSSVGPARVAARRLAGAGQHVRVVALRVLSPLPMQAIARAIHGARRIIVIEQNHSAQLYRHLIGHKAIPSSAESVARPGPLPFRPSEVAAYVM
jgi:2-oxoglutarate/2-oxoacid ferredoxin oxidoreductase subunit alpha